MLGSAQTLAWASSYYLPAMLATPMARDLGVCHADRVRGVLAGAAGVGGARAFAGRAIDRWGGRPVLVGENVVFALGLVGLGLAHGPAAMFAAWVLLGVGMAAACTKPRSRRWCVCTATIRAT